MKYLVLNLDEARELGLSLEAATLLAAVRLYTKHSTYWTNGYRTTAAELLLSGKHKAEDTFKSLVSKGLIEKTDSGYQAVSPVGTGVSREGMGVSPVGTVVSPEGTLSKEERTKEEKEENKNIIINPKKEIKPSFSFKKFWELFLSTSNGNNWENELEKSFEVWNTLSPEHQCLAVQYATKHSPKSNPTVWLRQRDFLNKLDCDIDRGVLEFKHEVQALFEPDEVEKLFNLCFDVDYSRSTHKLWWKSIDTLRLRTLLENSDDRCQAIVKLAYKHFQKRDEQIKFGYKQI